MISKSVIILARDRGKNAQIGGILSFCELFKWIPIGAADGKIETGRGVLESNPNGLLRTRKLLILLTDVRDARDVTEGVCTILYKNSVRLW